jgi:hypothetical protein
MARPRRRRTLRGLLQPKATPAAVEMVRSLSGDRERLMARLAMIERNLEDVTGSLKRQAALPPPAATPPHRRSSAGQPNITAAPPSAPPSEPAAAPPPAATAEPIRRNVGPPGGLPDLQAIEGRPAAGVDVGGARDFDGLRTLWSIIAATHPDLFDGLHPIVTVREDNRSRGADLRLVAGPLTDVESASRICTTLACAKRYCRLVAFEGQPLALNAPPPPPPLAGRRATRPSRARRQKRLPSPRFRSSRNIAANLARRFAGIRWHLSSVARR